MSEYEESQKRHAQDFCAAKEQITRQLSADEWIELRLCQSYTELRKQCFELTPSTRFKEHQMTTIRTSLEMLDDSIRSLSEDVTKSVDYTILWGMLSLILNILNRGGGNMLIIGTINNFGGTLVSLNAWCDDYGIAPQFTDAALEIHTVMLTFLIELYMCWRTSGTFDNVSSMVRNPPLDLHGPVKEHLRRIEAGLQEFVRLRAHQTNVLRLQSFFSLNSTSTQEEVNLPCIMLPATREIQFFHRYELDDAMKQIESCLDRPGEPEQFRSLEIGGMGGTGKTCVALQYARQKAQDLDAVLWIRSETKAGLQESFSKIAVQLQLKGALPHAHEENRIRVLDWLQKTTHKWLLIYDNAEDSELLLKYWPVASHGTALITTKSESMIHQRAETAFTTAPFDRETGAKFLLHLFSLDIADINPSKLQLAKVLSETLEGRALLLMQMAGLIRQQHWTIDQFLAMYKFSTPMFSGENDPFERTCKVSFSSLDDDPFKRTCKVSFSSLDDECVAFLSVLALVNPENIPQALFEPADTTKVPHLLKVCNDELLFETKVLNVLVTLAFIKYDTATRTFSIDRRVQTSAKQYFCPVATQKAFENATTLLYEAFPQMGDGLGQQYDRWEQCQLYSPHVLELVKHYEATPSCMHQLKPTVLFCELLKNTAWYFAEIASSEDQLVVFRALARAAIELDPSLLHGDIATTIGLLWSQRGRFDHAEHWLRKALDQKDKDQSVDHIETCWAQIDLATTLCSRGKHEEALELQLSALNDFQKADDDGPTALSSVGQFFHHIGRSKYLLDQPAEARAWLDMSRTALTGSKDYASVSYAHFALGNLFLREGHFTRAREEFQAAQTTFLEGAKIKTHHYNGACMYKLGCVAAGVHDYKTATKYLRNAQIISEMHKDLMPADYTRVLYKLSEILKAQDGDSPEARRHRITAKYAAELEVHFNYEALHANDEEQMYDSLVHILWR